MFIAYIKEVVNTLQWRRFSCIVLFSFEGPIILFYVHRYDTCIRYLDTCIDINSCDKQNQS